MQKIKKGRRRMAFSSQILLLLRCQFSDSGGLPLQLL